VKFGFIVKHRGIWPAGWLCDALGVSRGGFYAWLTRPRSQPSRSDEEISAKVRASFLGSDRTYGARRVWRDLAAEGVSCGLHRIERLMRQQALKARPRRRRLPPDLGERQAGAIAPNVLDRSFEASAPNRKWIADFTYVWTAEGWLYVAAVVDLFSRRVVGWSMSAGMTAQLVTDALVMAIWRRGKPDALLHHSDRGSQYSSEQFQRLAANANPATVSDAAAPATRMVDGVPMCALDKHTRLGRDAIRRFASENEAVRTCLERNVPARARRDAAYMAAYYTDAVPVTKRLMWQGTVEIEALGTETDFLKVGVPLDGIAPLLAAFRAGLPRLDEVRAQVFRKSVPLTEEPPTPDERINRFGVLDGDVTITKAGDDHGR
jgi:putative transposase